MKKVLLSLCAYAHFFTAVGITVKMPAEDILQERLKLIELGFFTEKTSIIRLLANKKKTAISIASAIEYSIGCFNQYDFGTPEEKNLVNEKKPLIYEVILKDHPEALKTLEEQCRDQPTGRLNKLLSPSFWKKITNE